MAGDPETGGLEMDEEKKREALRKAGQEYFDRVLAEASIGKDPFAPEPVSQRPAEIAKKKERKNSARKARPQKEDPDLEAVGDLIAGAQHYLLTTLFVASSAAGVIFMKASLNPLETPGLLTFIHLLPVLALITTCSGLFELEGMTVEGAKASLATAVSSVLQVMMTFSSLLHNSVSFVLAYQLSIAQLLLYLAERFVLHSAPSGRRQVLCAAGIAGVVLVGLGDVAIGGVSLPPLRSWAALAIWTLAKAAEVAWGLIKHSPGSAIALLGDEKGSRLLSMSEAEEELPPSNRLLYKHLLPAVPVLILGFCGLEGRELIEHELSVPAVTAIIFSSGCFLCSAVCGLLLDSQWTPRLKAGLLGVAALGTVVLDMILMGTKFNFVSTLGVVLSCCMSVVIPFLPEALIC